MENIWKEIKDLTTHSNRDIEIIQEKTINADCEKLGVSEDSVLYSVVLNSNGIIIDNWIRIWGQSSSANEGILYYNSKFKDNITGMLLVASDVVGGVFALNISKYGKENLIWYFAPDTLEWECLDMKYNEFLAWTFQGNIDEFYETMRWENWKEDVKGIELNKAVFIYPFLWAKECDLENASKKVVPIDEIIEINFEYSNKLKI